MKTKIKDYKLAIFFALYSVFTIICGCLSWMFSKQRREFLRLNKLKNKIKYWKE